MWRVCFARPYLIEMISRQYKFVFIHVPKTAGNSIQLLLAPYAECQLIKAPSPVADLECGASLGQREMNGVIGLENFWVHDIEYGNVKHWRLAEYVARLGGEIERYRILSCVRNPFDWCISLYFFRKQACRNDGYRWIRAEGDVASDVFNADEYIDFLNSGELPQHSYLADCQAELDLNVIRYERIREDIARIWGVLGLPTMPTLPHVNKSRRTHWEKLLCTRVLIQETRRVFWLDFVKFGYGDLSG